MVAWVLAISFPISILLWSRELALSSLYPLDDRESADSTISPCYSGLLWADPSSAIRTRWGPARREAAVRRFGAERLAGANALQVNQWPNPRCSVRGPLIESRPARIAPLSSACPR